MAPRTGWGQRLSVRTTGSVADAGHHGTDAINLFVVVNGKGVDNGAAEHDSNAVRQNQGLVEVSGYQKDAGTVLLP